MLKIKFSKAFASYKKDDVIELKRNLATRIILRGFAKAYKGTKK